MAVDVNDIRSSIKDVNAQLLDIKNALEMKSQSESDLIEKIKNGGGLDAMRGDIQKMGYDLPNGAIATSSMSIQMQQDLNISMSKNLCRFASPYSKIGTDCPTQ